ncbi:MAG: DUF362 domain-containing protein [Peptococcaceae bacterium]|jgi:hypothetical protein|nr:DUF362 domain-containing protein [Peptococcaceae bacterium]MDH7525158.1 DUF362 domain-containing protein [Peptococcaceae bacterium]
MYPRFMKVRQKFPGDRVENITTRLDQELDKLELDKAIKKGDRVAITAGSRGIKNIPLILSRIAGRIYELGGKPFLVSAMGSHGGGTPEGQRKVLASLGITEGTVGCPISCSEEVVKIGVTPSHRVDVYCAREAVECDGVVVVNRVKRHTAFRAPRESGILKMIGIGLGRVPGAEAIHSCGPEEMGQVILELARVVSQRVNILGGIAILENGYDETAGLYGLKPAEFEEQEAALLKKSDGLRPSLPVEEIDLLIVDEMGKNYSGTGMDSNVIGRWRIDGLPEPEKPRIKRLVVLDLSLESHGNANGIGLADFTTRKLVDKIDFRATYLNAITTGYFQRAAVPITAGSDREAVEMAFKTLKKEKDRISIVRIKNTLYLDEVWMSQNLRDYVLSATHLEIAREDMELTFDQSGNIGSF